MADLYQKQPLSMFRKFKFFSWARAMFSWSKRNQSIAYKTSEGV